jgi:hypothetical protein
MFTFLLYTEASCKIRSNDQSKRNGQYCGGVEGNKVVVKEIKAVGKIVLTHPLGVCQRLETILSIVYGKNKAGCFCVV